MLWIGYLQWHIRSFGDTSVAEPVIHDYGNIECRDAVLAWDGQEPMRDDTGNLVTRWDGRTTKLHPATGERVPDEKAVVPQWRYLNPRQAEWPQADFIVGNPPFIGSKLMRTALGDGYVDALQHAWPEVPEATDFVMRWWHKAALAVRAGSSRRFGLITSNSLRQTYVRRAVEPHLAPDAGMSIAYAVPDHPWVDASDGASVRIAMTVGVPGALDGRLAEVVAERADSDGTEDLVTAISERKGRIGADLRIGPKVASAAVLNADLGLCSVGMKTIGSAFQVDDMTAAQLGLGSVPGLDRHIRPYLNGRDFASTARGLKVIDLYGLDEANVRARFPAVYQHLLDRAKPERDLNRNALFRRFWWVIGHPRPQFRAATEGIARYIVTVETAKHRIFAFLPRATVPDSTLVTFAFDDALWLGLLAAVGHVEWSLAAGGRLGVGNDPRYNKSRCFETFPFPSDDTGLTPELTQRIRNLAEQLDAHRKARQAAHPELTLTGMYNVLDKLRRAEPLAAKDKAIHQQGLVSVLKSLHDELDAAVLQAYGWADLQAPLADHTRPDLRAAAVELLLERLVSLNARRAAEEAAGKVRWLRPDFQQRGAADQQPIDLEDAAEADDAEAAAPAPAPAAAVPKRPWPAGLPEQIKLVAEVLASSPRALSLADLEQRFTARGRWRQRLPSIVDTLEALGRARRVDGAPVRWQSA